MSSENEQIAQKEKLENKSEEPTHAEEYHAFFKLAIFWIASSYYNWQHIMQ